MLKNLKIKNQSTKSWIYISYDIFICMFGIQAKIQGNIKTIMLDRKLQQRVKKATLHVFLDFFTIQISVLRGHFYIT
jgi:hypothetical protein